MSDHEGFARISITRRRFGDYREPGQGLPQGTVISADDCPHCGIKAKHTRNMVRDLTSYYTKSMIIEKTYDEQWICDYCNKPSLFLVHLRRSTAELIGDEKPGPLQVKGVRLLWPSPAPRELPDEAPDNVRSLFREAAVCEAAGALRGAGVLYRAAVEALCIERGAAGGNLWAKIEALGGLGLDPEVVTSFHEARMVGNDSIHAGVTYDAEEVADVAGLIEEAVHLLYVQPAERAAMRARRQARRDQARTARTP